MRESIQRAGLHGPARWAIPLTMETDRIIRITKREEELDTDLIDTRTCPKCGAECIEDEYTCGSTLSGNRGSYKLARTFECYSIELAGWQEATREAADQIVHLRAMLELAHAQNKKAESDE